MGAGVVARYKLSEAAKDDLLSIVKYTQQRWGKEQAKTYNRELRECCGRIASFQLIGRPAEALHSGLRRVEQGSHVVFYSIEGSGVVIRRILHKGMVAGRHMF